MKFTTVTPAAIRLPIVLSTDAPPTVHALVRVASIADVDRYTAEIPAGLSAAAANRALQERVIVEHIDGIEGVEVDGVYIGNPGTLVGLRPKLPASAGPLFSALFLAAMGGEPLATRPSQPPSQ